MKKNVSLLMLSLVFLLPSSKLHSQEMRYRDIKGTVKIENYKEVVTLPIYYAGIAGSLNYLFMGLGHIYVKEPLRGAGFLGAEIVAMGFFMYGFIMSMMEPIDGNYNSYNSRAILFGSFGAWSVIHIAGIYDAVKIARVKNYASQQQYVSLNISPVITIIPSESRNLRTLGIAFNLNF